MHVLLHISVVYVRPDRHAKYRNRCVRGEKQAVGGSGSSEEMPNGAEEIVQKSILWLTLFPIASGRAGLRMMTAKNILIDFLLKFIPILVLLVHGFAPCCDGTPRSMRAPQSKPSSTARAERAETSSTRLVFLYAITFFQK